MSATWHPCDASRRAVAEPAGPPPTTATSNVGAAGRSDIGIVVLAVLLPAVEMEAFAELIEVETSCSQPSFEIAAEPTVASGQACQQLAQPLVALAQVVDDRPSSAIGVGVAIAAPPGSCGDGLLASERFASLRHAARADAKMVGA